MNKEVAAGMLIAILMTLASPPIFAQDTIVTRTFSIVNVIGNSRFRDQDILVTADLRPGEAYTEDDIRAAVDALEFTGEFESVRIFSRGDELTISVVEEPEYTGSLSFGLGADSDIGIFGSIGLSLENVLGGNTISAQAILGEQVRSASASVSGDSFWPSEAAGGVRLDFADYDYEDVLFDFRTASIQPYLEFGDEQGFRGEFRLTGYWTDIKSVDPEASAIIQAEAGDRLVFGPGVGLRWSGTEDQDWDFGLSIDVYGGDAQFADAAVAFSIELPFISSTSLRSRGRFGTVRNFGDGGVTAADRISLGGSSLRGFARGGITPVDFCAGCGGGGADVTTRLGGNNYVVFQNDILMPNLIDGLPFVPSVYLDIGSVWNVDSPTPPSGVVNDEAIWRSSAGIALSAETPLGDFSASYAITTRSEDEDDEEAFTLSFTSEF